MVNGVLKPKQECERERELKSKMFTSFMKFFRYVHPDLIHSFGAAFMNVHCTHIRSMTSSISSFTLARNTPFSGEAKRKAENLHTHIRFLLGYTICELATK